MQQSRAANPGCGDYLILGVRGSGQKATDYDGWGRETATIRDGLLSKAPGLVVDKKAVDYTAAAVSVMAPTARQVALMTSGNAARRSLGFQRWRQTRLGAYLRSIANGVARVKQEVQSGLAACPDRPIVLVGYSQGSMAIHRALVDLAKSGDSKTLGSIAAVALLADGDHFPRSASTYLGAGSDDAQGIAYFGRSYRKDIPRTIAGRTYGYCTYNDIVCDATIANLVRFSSGTKIHTGYPEQELLDFGRIVGKRTFPKVDDPVATGRLVLGPRATTAAPAPQLDDHGDILLGTSDCTPFLASRGEQTYDVLIGSDGICFTHQLLGDGTGAFIAEYRREPVVPEDAPTCPFPSGYLYRFDRKGRDLKYVNIGDRCFYQSFKVSPNGRFLAVTVNQGHSILLRDLLGSRPDVIIDNLGFVSGVTNDGERLIYAGNSPLINSDGSASPDREESAIFMWNADSGSQLIAGGSARSYAVGAWAVSGDGSVVYFQEQPADDPNRIELHRWVDGSDSRILPDAVQIMNVSLSYDGQVAAVSYSTSQAVGRVDLATSRLGPFVPLSAYGGAGTADAAAVSGDGHYLIFRTAEALAPGDTDSDSNCYFLEIGRK